MKIAILADIHYGIRGDSLIVTKFFRKFFEETFFPYIDKENIKTIINVGDVFDRRKFINYNTLYESFEAYFDPIAARGIDHHIILGNHDQYFKNTHKVNSPELLLKGYDRTFIYKDPVELELDKKKLLFLPWLTETNTEQSLKMVASSTASYAFGHLQLKGFEMHKGVLCEDGMDMNLFQKFDKVCSGHFHKRSNRDNIFYLGTPFQSTWVDFGEIKGFHIFDTDDGSLTFVQNPDLLFHKIVYDDTAMKQSDLAKFKLDHYQDKYLKLIVRNKTNPYIFDKYITQLNEMKPANLVIIEEKQISVNEKELENIQVDDTPTILKKYVDSIKDEGIQKPRLVNLLTSLYQEANELDTGT